MQVDFLQEIAEALWSCHQIGVIHKDISPGNIMVREDFGRWRPVLIDFGLASHPDDANTRLTSLQYTPGYVPPEKHNGEPRLAPADVYCLGLLSYELLTGKSPFRGKNEEWFAAQKAFDFTALVELRPELPGRLAELVESMLLVSPFDRPDAITVAKSFSSALEPEDWSEYVASGMQKFAVDSFGPAFDLLCKGVFAQDADIRSRDFIDGIETLLIVASNTGKLGNIAQPLVKRFCQSAAACGSSFPATVSGRLIKDLEAAASAQNGKHAIAGAIDALCESIENGGPILALCDALELLMESVRKPAFWGCREELFLLFSRYASEKLISLQRLGHWCVRCCNIGQANTADTADYTEGQLWLQRAERCGLKDDENYGFEYNRLNPILLSVGANKLPNPADQEDPHKILGNDEQGHFNVERMVRWSKKVQQLYPWVVGVRRVRGDGAVDRYPTRILELNELARHAKGLPCELHALIIPIILDASFSATSKDRATRANITLPPGTTTSQREAAIRKLRENTRLFPSE